MERAGGELDSGGAMGEKPVHEAEPNSIFWKRHTVFFQTKKRR
jgi:hypothetical protein